MALFYFDVVEPDGTLSEDDSGAHLHDLAAARAEARKLIASMFYHERRHVDPAVLQVHVLDAGRRRRYTATLMFQTGQHS